MKILVIEDETKLAGFIINGLTQAGYMAIGCGNGAEGLQRAASEQFDIILLDLMLPGTNGFDVLKNLRDFRIETPVIILSALGDTVNIVKGLDLGAVDYVRKPFEWEELMARIRSIQRKLFAARDGSFRIDDLCIDPMAREVTREGKEIILTTREFLLLEYLARNANRVVTKNQILENVWEFEFDPESNIVEVYIYQLRKKIDRGFETKMLETIVGTGYKLKGNKL